MLDFIFKKIQEKLSEFDQKSDKSNDEIRQCKAEIQQLRMELDFEKQKGHFIRDDERLILSAPEIIIGNVDSSGMLYMDTGSTVVVRGSQVDLQGVGQSGQVEVRASGIRQIAEDPGCDGLEHVVYSRSEVVSQARDIVLHSQDADGVFSALPAHPLGSGVRIHADQSIEIDASQSSKRQTEMLTALIDELKNRQTQLSEQAANHKSSFRQLVTTMEQMLVKRSTLTVDDEMVRSCYQEIGLLNRDIEHLSLSLSEEVCNYAEVLSLLSETKRQLNCLDSQIKAVKGEDAFKNEPTGASVSITGETVSMESRDGDGHLRENKEAGISLSAPNMVMTARRDDGTLHADGQVTVRAMNVEVNTADTKDVELEEDGTVKAAQHPLGGSFSVNAKDIRLGATDQEVKDGKLKDKELTAESKITLQALNVEVTTAHVQNVETDAEGQVTKAEYPADGEVLISSKAITIEAADTEFAKDSKHHRKEKSLAEGGCIQLRSEHIGMAATATDGKATGDISLNAKDLKLQAADISDNKLSLAEGGGITAIADRISIGDPKDKKLRGQKLQAWAEKLTLAGSKLLQAVQGDGKAFLLLKDKACLKGDATELHNSTKIVGDLDAPNISGGDIKVKGEFKTTNISDGVTAGPAPKSTLKPDNDD